MGGTDEIRAELDGLLASLRSGAAGSTPQALPARAYSSPALFALEVDRIFRREWLLVARADEIPDTGDRVTVDVVGEPVVIVRGEDQRLRALSGVCRHRYFPLSEPGFSTGRRLTCSYHRWSYGLDGRCVAAPLMDDTPGFDRSQIALPSLPLEEWEGFVFVSLDPEIEPLSPRLDPISAELARHRLAEQQQTTRYSAVWSGNWKAAVENGSESYHHMGLHSRTVQPYMPAQGSTFVTATDHFAWHRTPIARFADRHGTRAGLDTGLTDADRGHARFFTIFPATVISVVGDSVDWITFLPLSPDRVHAFGGFVFPTWAIDPEELERLRTTQAKTSEQINEEDRASVERLQQVVGSRLAAPGPLNVREGALGAFARYLARRLAAGPTAG
jgi:phenylpropionate dioxygenase-like ring-hydroxylating dioxygenase large terminal subunit